MKAKYRCWDKLSNKMRQVHALCFDDSFGWDVKINQNNWRGFGDVELMRYTGLLDKNGEQYVYEGDIVRLSRYLGTPGKFDTVTGVVKWYAPEFKVDIDGFDRCELHGAAEVIGNIYETPELLDHNTKPQDILKAHDKFVTDLKEAL